MSKDGVNSEETVRNAKAALDEDQSLSPSSKTTFEVLLLIVSWLLVNRPGLNRRNSRKPASIGPDRPKKPRHKTVIKSGGQQGHDGVTLEKIHDPDHKPFIPIDKRTLSEGRDREGAMSLGRFLIEKSTVSSANIRHKC